MTEQRTFRLTSKLASLLDSWRREDNEIRRIVLRDHNYPDDKLAARAYRNDTRATTICDALERQTRRARAKMKGKK